MNTKPTRFVGHRGIISAVGSALLCGISLSPAQAQIANTLAFYNFNNGTFQDSSGNGNTGTPSAPTAPTATAAGFQGGGMQLKASDNPSSTPTGDYFTAPINISPTALPNLTFGGWFDLSSTALAQTGLISNDTGGFGRTLDIDNRGGSLSWSAFNGGVGSGVLASDVAPTVGVWTFVAAVYNQSAAMVTLYVDPSGGGTGLQSFSSATGYTNGTSYGASIVTVGRNPNFDNAFNGTIDNIFFVGSALTPTQIQNIDTNGQNAFGASAAPEPGTLALALPGGLAAIGFLIRRRR